MALATPFKSDFSVDFPALARLVDYQIAGGASYLVVLATTSEAVTLTCPERAEVARFVADRVAGRVPLILGMSDNCTQRLAEHVAEVDLSGYSAILSVVPYYNKPSQEGIYRHFKAVAEASPLPVVLYNVPGRTGRNMEAATTLRLARELPGRIVGIKEASGNISQVAKIAQLCGDELNIYSGNDDQVVPLLSLGGKGVISVVSNVKPELVHNCCKAWFEGDTKTACKLQLEILPLADALFCEVNPIPVKYAMNVLGWEAGPCRLPLVEPSDAHKEKIEQALAAEGLIQE